jgi:hypothetical protein
VTIQLLTIIVNSVSATTSVAFALNARKHARAAQKHAEEAKRHARMVTIALSGGYRRGGLIKGPGRSA